MGEQHLEQRWLQGQKRGLHPVDCAKHRGGIELPNDVDRDTIVEALKHDSDVEQVEIGQAVDETVPRLPFVSRLEMLRRSEERRVGKECVSTGRYRVSPAH